jgi:hypothetical protein
MADGFTFDPARDGFGFRNPTGRASERTGGGTCHRRSDAFVYGIGLCFGMTAAVLLSFSGEVKGTYPPLVGLSLTPDLDAVLREYQLLQFHPRVVLATVREWVASGGGSPERVLGRLRTVGAGSDPHVLCFGPAPNRRFLHCLARAHAVVPYRVEEERVYVYDPNHPQDRDRFVKFTHGEFEYGGFRSREGWGITLVPSHALSVKRVTPVRPNRDWPIATYP